MPAEDDDRAAATDLRGRLSEVYFPALVEGARDSLAKRLGDRATIDDPLFGSASTPDAVIPALERIAPWLGERGAKYTREHATTGIDRDVSEGVLTVHVEGREVSLPVAVVCERRKSREVLLRVYYSSAAAGGAADARARLVARADDLILPKLVSDALDAMRSADLDALLATFEEGARVRDARNGEHAKKGAAMRALFAKLCGAGGFDVECGGAADDDRTCAVEGTAVAGRALAVPVLLVFGKGDSGRFDALRLYDDLIA